jgi:hypothetical protein
MKNLIITNVSKWKKTVDNKKIQKFVDCKVNFSKLNDIWKNYKI